MERWKYFQGVSKVDDRNKDKTVKSVCDPIMDQNKKAQNEMASLGGGGGDASF